MGKYFVRLLCAFNIIRADTVFFTDSLTEGIVSFRIILRDQVFRVYEKKENSLYH